MNSSFYSTLKQRIWIILIPVAFCLVLFQDAIFTSQTLFHMDWAPYFPRSNWIGPWQHFVVNHAPFSLMHIMKACLPLRFYHVAFYIVSICGTVWALTAYLRDRTLSVGAALLGGLAFGFSGYCASLVSAGHRGVFEACLSAAVLLFVGSRAIRRGNWFYYFYSALAIALVIGTQPDVFFILLLVVGPLLLVDLVHELRAKSEGCIKTLSLGALVFVVAMTITGWRGVEKIITNFLPGREALIEQSGATGEGGSERSKWIFCTNWSLPPSDCVELVAPLVLGVESTDRELPFWGKLGRSYDWQPGAPGFPNYRQNTVYAGGIQLVLAFYTILLLFRRSRAGNQPDRALLTVAAVLVVVLFVLALGRYSPFYRLFYALPLASSIRCPVKFLHAVNLAGAVLCAFGAQALMMRFREKTSGKGVAALLREPEGMTLSAILLVLVGLVVAKVAVGSGWVNFGPAWSALGFDAGVQNALLDRLTASLVHAMLVFGLIGFLFFRALRERSATWSSWVPWVCVLAVAIDMTTVNIHYVNTVDLSVQEMRNVMVEDMIAGKDYEPRVLDLITGWNKHNPIRANLAGYYSQDIVMVGKEQRKNREFFTALQQGGASMQKAVADFDVEYVIAPAKLAGNLQALGSFSVVGSYGFDGKKFIRVPSNRAAVVLFSVH